MKRYTLALVLLSLLFAAADSRGPVSACFATPQATVTAYWHRMIEHRHREALECFVDASSDATGMLGLPDLVELRPRDFTVQDRGGGIVDVTYSVEYRPAMGDSLQRFPTGDRLELTGAGWKIARPILVASRP